MNADKAWKNEDDPNLRVACKKIIAFHVALTDADPLLSEQLHWLFKTCERHRWPNRKKVVGVDQRPQVCHAVQKMEEVGVFSPLQLLHERAVLGLSEEGFRRAAVLGAPRAAQASDSAHPFTSEERVRTRFFLSPRHHDQQKF